MLFSKFFKRRKRQKRKEFCRITKVYSKMGEALTRQMEEAKKKL